MTTGGLPQAWTSGVRGEITRDDSDSSRCGNVSPSRAQRAATAGLGVGGLTVTAFLPHPVASVATRTTASGPLGFRGALGLRGALGSEVDDGTGQRPGDAGHRLHLGNDELAELVDAAGLA